MTPEIAAEAAVWVARLHGPDRSVRMEQEFLQWQARSAEHRLAFERCTDTWELVGGLTLVGYASSVSPSDVLHERAPASSRRAWVVAAAGALALVFWAYPRFDPDSFETGVGERRTVVLRDGSRLSLNTASRVRVRFSPERRVVELESGEALFEVTKDPGRPFVVQTDGIQVRAVGTTFVVRSAVGPAVGPPIGSAVGSEVTSAGMATSAGTVSVTLVEGRVVVGEGEGKGIAAVDGVSKPIEMTAGERLRIASSKSRDGSGVVTAAVARDRPRMDQAVAWQRGEAVFEDAHLLEAVTEMNRYSATPIVVAEEGAGERLRVSGVFRTSDNASFARAVAKLHGLRVVERADRIELSR